MPSKRTQWQLETIIKPCLVYRVLCGLTDLLLRVIFFIHWPCSIAWFTTCSFRYQPCQRTRSAWSGQKSHIAWVERGSFSLDKRPMVQVAHWRTRALSASVYSFLSMASLGSEGDLHLLHPAWRWGSCNSNCFAFHIVVKVLFSGENSKWRQLVAMNYTIPCFHIRTLQQPWKSKADSSK